MSHQLSQPRRNKRKPSRAQRKLASSVSRRSLHHETLERRELLAAEIIHASFVPGTTQEQIEQWEQQNHSGLPEGAEAANLRATPNHWTLTASGASPSLGDPATITWSIVPDDTGVAGLAAGEQSDLVAFLDGIYGNNGAAANDPLVDRPWFGLFQRVFDAWEETSGIDFVYEPNDDGITQNVAGSSGELGVRGDIRISGGDGSSAPSVLAFAFGPNSGDVVIDTTRPFYANNADAFDGPNRGFHNTIAHEVGHSIGLGHVAPNLAGNALMEPTISLDFRGPQHDDILGVQTLYGDRFGDNDVQANAVSLGTLGAILPQTNLSIDQDSDVDWFSFDAVDGQLLSLSVLPDGEIYDLGEDGGAVTSVNTALHSDLRFEIYDPSGNVISNQSSNLLGESEFVFSLPLTEDGTYTVGVFGTSPLGPATGITTPTQLYTLNINEGATGNPKLLAVAANASDLFDLDPQDQTLANVRESAPTELVLTFGGNDAINPATLASGVSVQFSESGNFAVDAQPVELGFIDLDDSQRIVTLRFAENLNDGFYQLSISSELESVTPLPFAPNFPQPVDGNPSLVREVVSFEIELGAKVVSVVAQPIDAGVPRLNEIDVYFDQSDLFSGGSTVSTPAFYQLVDTKNTAATNDDVIVTPTGVAVDAASRKVTLTFASDLDALVSPGNSLRLRVGDGTNFSALNVTSHNVVGDPGLTAATANTIPAAAAGSWTVSLTEQIRNVGVPSQVDNPGSTNEPGHRDIEVEDHLFTPRNRDADDSISTMAYTFLRNTPYATNSQGDPLFNEMSTDQEQRFLEILDIYADLLGIQFYEHETDGLTLIVGDLATASPTVVSGPGGVAGLGGPGGVTMDSQDFNSPNAQAFGTSFFDVALHEIGHALGLGHAYDLPPGTVQGANGNYPDGDRTVNEPGVEWAFPGDNDIVHGLLLWQNESLDVDLYQVDIAETGVLDVNAVAARLADSSLLDTSLTLYRQATGGALELVSSNDDYFGTDSYIQYDVEPGIYFVGVAAQGNTSFDPDSGIPSPGGGSEGVYELRVDFTSKAAGAMVDGDGSLLDGNRDGEAGGIYDFWFEPTAPNTIFVSKEAGTVGALGQLTNPYTDIPAALAAAEALVASGTDGVVVRLLPNGGADGDITTPVDNIAFEIGIISALNQTLADGRNLDLPGGIQLVIDAGVVMKFLDSRISIGSDDDGFDRSESTISVQGTPELPVYFTSFNDRTLGANSNILNLPAASGDWGGIEIRNDADRQQGRRDIERDGIFQNYINHAQMSFGGGEVSTIDRVIDPVHLSQARAEISYNTITRSSDAAMSADPDTFEVTTFTETRFQKASVNGAGFVADYERVGPSIYGNTLLDNSTNGIFIRIDTPPGGQLETLQVVARFDDTDIVHALSENLVIEGAPGGAVMYSTRPAQIIGLTATSGGSLPADDYSYSYTLVDSEGYESPASTPQLIAAVPANSQVSLTDIPAATGKFVGRRLYRRAGAGDFVLVADLDKTSPNYTDSLAVTDASAPVLDVNDFQVRHGSVSGGLVIDPGTILKTRGAHIAIGFGANLIAEGLPGKEIIFTSRNDDQYGAGGTFDTNGDGGGSVAQPRDWGGIYAAPTSRLSIDSALIAYAGGVTGTIGGTASFNPIQIHQADARIANTLLRDNGNGQGGGQLNGRRGFAPNSDAVIHVTAAQPTIVGNTFMDNVGAAIDINANALNSEFNQDLGRQTGDVDRYELPPGNTGAVVRGNEMSGNTVNGMVVRGEVLTTEVVWDDTDIVHVLANDIEIPDFHTYGGLRLESSSTESLIVKLDNAEILATGRSIDTTDRIGGRLHVLGSPGFPVILTSINDDTVGASFAPDGSVQTQTISAVAPNSPTPGDWQGLKFDAYSFDRNVSVVTEREGEIGGFGDLNANIGAQQELGILAPNQKSGDENIRLGYTVHGAIAADNDQDVFSFEGFAGTMVWIDIDETDSQLDTVLEVLDGNGRVLALSQDSRTESANGQLTYTDTSVIPDGHALPMKMDHDAVTNATGDYRDLYTTNDGDSALRIRLPGTVGSQQTFYVRVRSNNLAADLTTASGINASLATGGTTKGGYRLQLRLQEIDDFAGSVVRYADIRYATKAIDVIGLPVHSTIAGEVFNPGGTVDLGSFANTDLGAISANGNASSVDTYQFTIGRDGLQGINPTDNSQSLVFDVDFADGLTRPNTNLYLLHDGELIAIGTDSNIADDRITPIVPGQPTTVEDLSRGSIGGRDPFIGPLELSPNGNYELIVANDSLMAGDLTQFTDVNAANKNARLEPLDGIVRVIDDRFNIGDSPTGEATETPFALQVGFETEGDNIIPWQFGDVPLIVFARQGVDDGDVSQVNIFNPLTGRHDAIIDEDISPIGAAAQSPRNVALAIERPIGAVNDANTDEVYRIGNDGVLTSIGTTGLVTHENFDNGDANPTTNSSRVSVDADGVAFSSLAYYNDTNSEASFLYGLANRATFRGSSVFSNNGTDTIGGTAGDVDAGNLIYLLDPDTGAAISRNGISMRGGFESANPQDNLLQNDNGFNIPDEAPWAGTNVIAQIQVPTSNSFGLPTGNVNSLVTDVDGAQTLYAFTDQGAVWSFAINENGAGNNYGPGDLQVPMDADGSLTGFRVADSNLLINPNFGQGIFDIDGNLLIFEEVTKGPANFADVNDLVGISDLYFGIQAGTGRLYAFSLNGNVNFAEPVFSFGAESAQLDLTNAGTNFAGFFFSPLDQSLWHASDTLNTADGHGMDELDDRADVEGGGSLRFGFDALNDDFNHLSVDADNNVSADDLQNYSGYSFLGGAHGTVQSNTIDLSGFSNDDLPTLYFTYVLDSENVNATTTDVLENETPFTDGGLDNVMRDSLRVYVAGDDGEWATVATNNFTDNLDGRIWDDSRDGVNHEYEKDSSGYTDVERQIFVQELFDDNVFRQARIDLGPWAGQENVKIRYEFSSAGEARPDQTEIYAVSGERLVDEQIIRLSGNMPDPLTSVQGSVLGNRSIDFEFDLGLVARVPAGSSVTNPVALTRPNGTTVVELIPSGVPAADQVLVLATDTAEEVADKIEAKFGATTVRSSNHPDWVGFTAENTAGSYAFGSLGTTYIISEPGVVGANVPINVDLGMSDIEVRDQMQQVFADQIHYSDTGANLAAFPIVDGTSAVRVYDLAVVQDLAIATLQVTTGDFTESGYINSDFGPGIVGSAEVPGTNYGVYTDSPTPSVTEVEELLRAGERSRGLATGNNGVYIDDIVIGLAERGESLTNSTQGSNLVDNPYFEALYFAPDGSVRPVVAEVTSGSYQLESRLAQEYLGSDNAGKDSRVNLNERLGDTFSFSVNSSGAEIVDGDTFNISNGSSTVTFEFNDTSAGVAATPVGTSNVAIDYKTSDTAGVIAERIRAKLNSATLRAILGIEVTSAGGEIPNADVNGNEFVSPPFSSTDTSILFHGYAAFDHSGATFVEVAESNQIADATGNIDIESAFNLDEQPWGTSTDTNVDANTSRPHLIIDGIGQNASSFYSFTTSGRVAASFDIDGADFDAGLILYGPTGSAVGAIDDSFYEAGSFTPATHTSPFFFSRDPKISLTLDVPGTYVLQVSRVDILAGAPVFNPINAGDRFDLSLGIEGQSRYFSSAIGGQDLLLGEDLGDQNRVRQQGQFIIDSNVISFSANAAIDIRAGDTAAGIKVSDEGDRPKPGAVQGLPTLNGPQPGTLHGAVVQNNLLISNGNGITLSGNGDQGGPNVFSRIVNNTVFGSNNGILIQDQAAPTLLNNALSTNSTGISASGAGPTVIRGTLYDGNTVSASGVGVGTEAIVNPSGDLFVNPASGNFDLYAGTPNFYPAVGSALIDVGIASQGDRPNLISVKDSVGIPASPIVVTEVDLAGQIRRDGSTSSGQGQNVNIDIGALDRSDTTGPEALIIVPTDNDAFNIDVDRVDTFLQLTEGVYSFFEILITEGSGIGPDSSTITPDQLTILENGRQMFPGRDVVIGYNASNRTLRFRPLSGTWRNDAVYEIIMQNQSITLSDGTVIDGVSDLAGNQLQPNRADGQTRFTIVMPGVDLDLGDAPDSYDTKFGDNGARHAIIDFGNRRLGQYVDGEPDSAGVGLDDALAVVTAEGNVHDPSSSGPFAINTVGGVTTIDVTGMASLNDNLQVTASGRLLTFELVPQGSTASVGRVPVEYAMGATPAELTTALANVMAATLPAQNVLAVVSQTGATQLQLVGADDEDGASIGQVTIGGTTIDGVFLDPVTNEVLSYLNPLSPGGAELVISTVGGGVLDLWIDFSGDGDFLDAGERVLIGEPMANGENRLQINTPASPAALTNGTGTTWARFRLSESGSAAPNGLVVGGEVEDYVVFIAEAALPEPTDDEYALLEDNSFSLPVATSVGVNDTPAGAASLQYILESDVSNGTLVFNSDGSLTYDPAADFYGTDTFTYRLTGTQDVNVNGTTVALPVRSSRAGTVTFTVEAVNDPPVATNFSYVTTEPSDTNLATAVVIPAVDLLSTALPHIDVATLNVPFNEFEQRLKIAQVSVIDSTGTSVPLVGVASMLDPTTPADGIYFAPTHLASGTGFVQTGTVTINVVGGAVDTLTYQPAADFNENNPTAALGAASVDQFVFTVADDGMTTLPDGNPAVPQPAPQTVEATVTIQVRPQNDQPTATDDAIDSTTLGVPLQEDTPFTIPTALLLANDFAGQQLDDDESTGVNDGAVSLVTAQGATTTTNIGSINSGIAVDDFAGGVGYIMYSEQSVFSRFAAAPPVNLPGQTNSNNLVAVRFNGFTWEYNNDSIWEAFTPVPTDRLLAQVDFDFDAIVGLQYATGTIAGIQQGYVAGDLVFEANQFGGQADIGEFLVTGTSFETSADPDFPAGFRAYPLTTLQGGTVSVDGSGNLLYVPPSDYYGPDAFEYIVADQGVNVAVDGTTTTQTKYDVATVFLTVDPVNDAPAANDQGFVTTEDTSITITADELRAGSVGHGNPTRPFPFDESNQDATTSVTALTIGTTTVTAANVGAAPFATTFGSIDAVNFDANGNLVDFRYTPNLDFNADNPRTGGTRTFDSFGYTLSDDGVALLPFGGTVNNPPQSVQAQVSIFVTPQNDAPAANDDVISSTSPVWNTFSTTNPVEDTALIIPAAFLLSNDSNAPLTAIDELNEINDQAALSVVPMTFTTALGGTVTLLPGGDLSYQAPQNRYGLDTFVYQVADQGVDEDLTGLRSLNPQTSPATVSILVEPVNDSPKTFNRSLAGVEDNVISFTAADLLATGPAAVAIDATTLPPTPFDENEQSLRVVAFADGDESIDVNDLIDPSVGNDGDGTLTLTTVSGGLLTFNFTDGAFVDGTYQPGADYNQRTPFAAVELFDYVIADDGATTIPGSGILDGSGVDTIVNLPDQRSAPAAVELSISHVNDPPSYQVQSVVNVLERDDSLATIVGGWATNVFPGPQTALDEHQRESVVFTYIAADSTVDPGLFLQDPSVDSSGTLSVHPAPDQIGTATIVLQVEDRDNLTPGFVPQMQRVTFTVNVQPTNDAPRINPAIAGTSESASADDAYAVAADGTVTFTLKEDNTGANGAVSPYVIRLNAPSAAGYSPIGLLDVFDVGPANEVSSVPGGSQVLSLFNYPAQTDLGGSLTPVVDGAGVVTGLEYTPPADYNNNSGVSDSFTYVVADNSTTGGETFSLFTDQLEPDSLTTTNRVRLNLTPVNDAPVFSISTDNLRVAEDAGLQGVAGFTFNFAAAPTTATDETAFATGQSAVFELSPVGISPAQLATSFVTPPTISASGVLNYESAADVFGQFVFEVSLVDDGNDDPARGDINRSNVETLTIDIRPVNDPPAINPAAVGSLSFSSPENSTLSISANGSNVSGDLLGAYTVGPANEAGTATPGGNQTNSLGTVPLTTVRGGTLTPVVDASGDLVSYDYLPPVNFVGQDSFVYQVEDDGESVLVSGDGSPTADPRTTDVTVIINVVGVNDPPIFTGADDVIVLEDVGLVTIPNWATSVLPGPLGALDEVSGATAQTVTASLNLLSGSTSLFATQPSVLLVGSTLTLSFETAPNASGVADLQLILVDSGPSVAADGDVNTTVHPFQIVIGVDNDPPTFTGSPAVVSTVEDSGPFVLNNWATNISPGPGDEAATQTVTRFDVELPVGSENLFSVLPSVSATGDLTFTPATNANGDVDVLVTAVDSVAGRSAPTTLTISITPEDDSPVAVDDQLAADEDQPLRIRPSDLLANDFDPDTAFDPNEMLQVVVLDTFTSALGATITVETSTGDLIYDPSTSSTLQAMSPGNTLADRFTYSITDNDGEDPLPSAEVLLTVSGINDEPTAADDEVFVAPSTGIEIDVLSNDSDIDGVIDPTSIIITLQPENGSLIVNDSGTITYVSDAGFTGPDVFGYTVGDDRGQQSERATVKVDVREIPTATPDSVNGVSSAGQIDIDVLSNDQGGFVSSTVLIESQPTNGTVTVLADGQIRYEPTAPFTGQDSFSYSVADSLGRRSQPGTVTLQFVVGGRQNQADHNDVNANGFISPLDAILIINKLGDEGLFISVPDDDFGPLYWDVNGSQTITPLDALLVINYIADQSNVLGEQVQTQAVVSDTIEVGTNLNRNGDQFEPVMPVNESTDRVIAAGSVAQEVDAGVIDLIVDDQDEDADKDGAAAVDAVLSDLF